MSEFNVERLRAAVEWAEKEHAAAGAWDQEHWIKGLAGERRRVDSNGESFVEVKCASAFCVAGNVCHQAGDRFVLAEWEMIGVQPGQPVSAEMVMPKGAREAVLISDRAAELLGIRYYEADLLFDADNSIEDVRRIAEEIAASYGEAL